MIGREPDAVEEQVTSFYQGYVTEERLDTWSWFDEPTDRVPEGTRFVAFMRDRGAHFARADKHTQGMEIEDALDLIVEAVKSISGRDDDDALRLATGLLRRLVKDGIRVLVAASGGPSNLTSELLVYRLDGVVRRREEELAERRVRRASDEHYERRGRHEVGKPRTPLYGDNDWREQD
jgi:hypothetical protein